MPILNIINIILNIYNVIYSQMYAFVSSKNQVDTACIFYSQDTYPIHLHYLIVFTLAPSFISEVHFEFVYLAFPRLFLKQLKTSLQYYLAISHLGLYPEKSIFYHRYICPLVLIAALICCKTNLVVYHQANE